MWLVNGKSCERTPLVEEISFTAFFLSPSPVPLLILHDGHTRTMDASARTLTASLILITTAALLARSIAPSSSSSSNGKPTTANQTKTQRVKRNNKKAN